MRELGSVTFRAFDTLCAVSADVDAAALREIEVLCARYELLLSRFNPESRLSALNAAAGEWVDVGDELAAVLRVALGYCERTGDLFDITMGGRVPPMGFQARRCAGRRRYRRSARARRLAQRAG